MWSASTNRKQVAPIKNEFCRYFVPGTNIGDWQHHRAAFVAQGERWCERRKRAAAVAAPKLRQLTRAVVRPEEESSSCCSSQAQTIDAAEGHPTPCWCGGVSPILGALSCASEPALCPCEWVENRRLHSLLSLYVPSSA